MKILRTILERLSRGRVLRRSITVAGKRTPVYVSPDAQLKYLKPGSVAFDQDLIHIAETFLTAHSNVWDIGANVGVFTFAAAAVATQGTIVSIEADIWLASVLRKTARLAAYRHSDIRVAPVAISETDGVARFLIARRGRASNALAAAGGRSQMGGVRETHYVPTLRLDTLLASMPAPDFVKIDVEGAEMMVLKGAGKILSDVRPAFYVEVGRDVSTDIMTLFKHQDYVGVAPDGRVLTDASTSDAFFIPQENQRALRHAGVDVEDGA